MYQWEKNTVINELKYGKNLTHALKNYLNPSSFPSSSSETCKVLIEKILSSHEKALSMLTFTLINEANSPTLFGVVGSIPQSDQESIDDQDFKAGRMSKKRKVMDKWSERKRVCLQNGQDQGSHGDGFNWRKYGQKVILGSNHPRGYFRCTHRNVQGCLATKQVQRSDDDSNFVEIKYLGRHTCNQAAAASAADQLIPKVATLEAKQAQMSRYEDRENAQTKETSMNFSANLMVKTEGLDKENPVFTFPSTTIESSQNVDSTILCELFPIMGGGDTDPYSFMGQYSPTFISPTTTSESNYFPMSHESPMSNNFDTRYNNPYHSCNSGLSDLISAATSVTNSPVPIENLDVFSSLNSDDDDILFRYDEDSLDFLLQLPV